MTKSSRIHFTFEGEPLETLFVAPTRDRGFSLGLTSPDNGNAHLTAYFSQKDQRIHAHITDRSAKQHMVWSTQISPEYFEAARLKMTRKWFRSADSLPPCWAMAPALWNRVRTLFPASGKRGHVTVPYEGYLTKVRLDFRRKDRWVRLKASELMGHTPRFGYTLIGGRPHIVLPLPPSGDAVLCFTERQSRLAQQRMFDLLGVAEYVRYLDLRRRRL